MAQTRFTTCHYYGVFSPDIQKNIQRNNHKTRIKAIYRNLQNHLAQFVLASPNELE